MKLKKTKNNFIIEVKDWSNTIIITNKKTGEKTKKTFSDHIIAITLANKL